MYSGRFKLDFHISWDHGHQPRYPYNKLKERAFAQWGRKRHEVASVSRFSSTQFASEQQRPTASPRLMTDFDDDDDGVLRVCVNEVESLARP